MLIKELLKYIGIDINNVDNISASSFSGNISYEILHDMLYNLSLMVFIFSIICLLSFINVLIYFLVLLYSDKSKFILNLSEQKPWIKRFLNLYKQSRISFIITEIIFFILSVNGMIFISFLSLRFLIINQ